MMEPQENHVQANVAPMKISKVVQAQQYNINRLHCNFTTKAKARRLPLKCEQTNKLFMDMMLLH